MMMSQFPSYLKMERSRRGQLMNEMSTQRKLQSKLYRRVTSLCNISSAKVTRSRLSMEKLLRSCHEVKIASVFSIITKITFNRENTSFYSH